MIGKEVKEIVQGQSLFGVVIGNTVPKGTSLDALSVELPSLEEIKESMKWPVDKPYISQEDGLKFLEAISKIHK